MSELERLQPSAEPVLKGWRRTLKQANRRQLPSPTRDASVFDAFGLKQEQSTAAYKALGALGAEQSDGHWMRVEPVHLHPDRDHVLVFDDRHLGVQRDEALALVAQLNETYQDDGWFFHALTPSEWLVKLPSRLQVDASPLSAITGRSLMERLPTGADAPSIIKRLNEIQMLFHAHAVNVAREEQGKPSISGVWLSGQACLPDEAQPMPFDQVFSEHPLSCGMAMHAGVVPTAIPDSMEALFSLVQTGNAFVDLGARDGNACVDCVRLALGGLHEKKWSELRLYMNDGCVYRCKRWQRFKFWVRA